MDPPITCVQRKILTTAVSAILVEAGFDCCDKMALETLTEMFQCFLTEVGISARNYCELASRTEPIIGDVILALRSMEIDLTGLEEFARRPNRTILPTPQAWQPQKQLNMLQAGTKQPHPSYVPAHLPSFPHPHAYIRTPTHKQPVTEYEAIREKAATQKRDMEKALTKFLARTGPIDNLFQTDDSNIYPLIACKKLYPPYLSALLPQDQIFDPEDLEYDPREDPANQQIENDNSKSKRFKPDPGQTETNPAEGENENEAEETNEIISYQQRKSSENSGNPEIDNPYLRATKMPRKKIITKINITNNTCSTVE